MGPTSHPEHTSNHSPIVAKLPMIHIQEIIPPSPSHNKDSTPPVETHRDPCGKKN